ncbi:hypothetical protein D3C86_1200000 [compost metagenome]
MAIVDADGEGLRRRLALGQMLRGRVGDAVVPAHRAVARPRGRIADTRRQHPAQRVAWTGRHADAVRIAEVHVVEGDRAAVAQGRRRRILGHRRGGIGRADRRRVVGAGDGHVDLPGDHAAVLVVHRDGEALDPGLARGQVLDGRGVHGVGPGELAARAGSRGVGVLDRRQAAQHAADRRAGGAHQVHIAQVQVAEADDAAVAQRAHRRDLLAHRAHRVLGCDHRTIVAAGDGDGHRGQSRPAIGVLHLVAEGVGGALARCQVLESGCMGLVLEIPGRRIAHRRLNERRRPVGRPRGQRQALDQVGDQIVLQHVDLDPRAVFGRRDRIAQRLDRLVGRIHLDPVHEDSQGFGHLDGQRGRPEAENEIAGRAVGHLTGPGIGHCRKVGQVGGDLRLGGRLQPLRPREQELERIDTRPARVHVFGARRDVFADVVDQGVVPRSPVELVAAAAAIERVVSRATIQ